MSYVVQLCTFFGCFFQIREVVGIAGGNFEERHIQLMEELHSHLWKWTWLGHKPAVCTLYAFNVQPP